MTDNAALSRHDFAALDLIRALPDQAAKVAARGNASKGVVSRNIADNLVMAGKAHYAADGRIAAGTAEVRDPDGTRPIDPAWEYPQPEGGVIDVPADQGEATGDALVANAEAQTEEPKTEKVNGRKAAAEKSPYSTATPTNRIKRHGKSRRTGTMTEIEDGLAKGSTFKVEGSGRYAVRCLTHTAETFVPDMTTAKPLQARTDEFCQKCATLVKDGAKHTDEAKAS